MEDATGGKVRPAAILPITSAKRPANEARAPAAGRPVATKRARVTGARECCRAAVGACVCALACGQPTTHMWHI